MQRFIKKAREVDMIDEHFTDFYIVELYDKFFVELLPLYEGKNPLQLPENDKANVLIDEVVLDRMVAHCYRLIAKNISSTLMSMGQIESEVDLCALMFQEGQMWSKDHNRDSAAKVFSNAYQRYYNPKYDGNK